MENETRLSMGETITGKVQDGINSITSNTQMVYSRGTQMLGGLGVLVNILTIIALAAERPSREELGSCFQENYDMWNALLSAFIMMVAILITGVVATNRTFKMYAPMWAIVVSMVLLGLFVWYLVIFFSSLDCYDTISEESPFTLFVFTTMAVSILAGMVAVIVGYLQFQ